MSDAEREVVYRVPAPNDRVLRFERGGRFGLKWYGVEEAQTARDSAYMLLLSALIIAGGLYFIDGTFGLLVAAFGVFFAGISVERATWMRHGERVER